MFTQTQDWILGYIFAEMHKDVALKNEINRELYIPKYWFPEIKTASRNKVYTLSEEQKNDYILKLDRLFAEFNTKDRTMKYTYTILPHEQYMLFRIKGELEPLYKEMTVQQIEEALGYKIKVIGGKA